MEELGLSSFVDIHSLKRSLHGFVSICFAVPFRQQHYAHLTNFGYRSSDYCRMATFLMYMTFYIASKLLNSEEKTDSAE